MKQSFQLLVFMLLSFSGMAQAICGFDELHQKMLTTDPTYATEFRKSEEQMRQIIINRRNNPQVNGLGTALYVIPVVVHVMHTGGALGSIYNPTDAQITAVIDYLNQVYDGTAVGMTGGAGDIQIQFALAKRDPNCNPTNGIVHFNAAGNQAYVDNGVNRSSSNGISDLALKSLSRWNPSDYYNIYLVNKIDGKDGTSGQFVAGYAYFPPASASLDGSVMLATQMEVGDKVLPHELGHALSLYHPFQGSNNNTQCPPRDGDCNFQGDWVCDTDPISNNTTTAGVTDFSCRTGTNSCSPGNTFSPNTESNIMSYTNCFSLFTPGQKTRMIDAMSLSSRASLAASLGATPPNAGTTQCPPKIVFQLTTGAIQEQAGTTADCRTYRDYTLNMIIGNSPSADATATLTTTGTATAGVDYIITTNGNFVTPSNVVSFQAGQNGLRPFTLRIFDDGAVEDPETIILNFTVNNGRGNAVKGDISTTLNLALYDNDVEPEAITGNAAFIGEYTVNIGSPFFGESANYKGQMLFTAAELQAAGLQAGTVTQMAFYVVQKNSTIPFNGFTIKMKNASESQTSSTPIAGATTVFGPVNYSTVPEENIFDFTTPFVWNGTSNILVEICWANGTAVSDNDIVASASNLPVALHQFNFNASANGCEINSLLYSYGSGKMRPMTGFTVLWPGPGVETVLNQSSFSYLGPNSDVFFYGRAGNILARIKNNSAHDYGCTEVKIDRAGITTKGLVNSVAKNLVTDKTISITPANNNPAGNYDLTLYYKLNEVQGWETATGLKWNTDAKIIKTQNAVSSYTPGAAPMAQVQEKTATKAGYGPDTTITANFTTGFSGFAVGNITDVLPVTWLEFKGALQNSNAVLIWKVQEVNNAAFDLEISRNGQDFVSLHKTPSKGNNNAANIYQYKQARPEPGINYYRVKQIDIDGRFTYSQTITLTVDGKGGGKPFVFPVPAKNSIVLNFGEILTRGSWEIFSADMRLVQRQKLSASALQQQINISMLPAGVYFIRLVTDNNQEMLRFVKE